ncbi:tRNA glutamyl-Q(34) synthetase GluQRS [Jannaschia sp. CCS1]|uniref:tRNA glutamyl-Q(34) synthetase GluQRS n=1 Tax=Jannaschia sp. (strain CCS1) TaxID=290400 RepID=UPI000053D13E|nr:tRNA glutamyl-Q(34) synthetase GluQRS [Jannaschia sp. CCS1]ABD55417.1 glutamyl-tRNA synthetase class Ic [Jannaschia sp. CCS1]
MITRFAPSPTGPLHLGHAYSAILAHDMALAEGGHFLLRIEDIDRQRSKPDWEAQIYDDLQWLGLHWDMPVLRQSQRMEAYRAALSDLWQRGFLFPCDCSRRDIQAALSAPQETASPPLGPDGIIYPGTCRHRTPHPNHADPGPMPDGVALRLRVDEHLGVFATPRVGGDVFSFRETGPGHSSDVAFTVDEAIASIGDIALARPDFGTSYHLSVVLDDAAQGVTHVTRGADLFEATKIHVMLQKILGLPTPLYHHHRLIRDDTGKRLAKRNDARAIAKYRADGASPDDVRAMVGL